MLGSHHPRRVFQRVSDLAGIATIRICRRRLRSVCRSTSPASFSQTALVPSISLLLIVSHLGEIGWIRFEQSALVRRSGFWSLERRLGERRAARGKSSRTLLSFLNCQRALVGRSLHALLTASRLSSMAARGAARLSVHQERQPDRSSPIADRSALGQGRRDAASEFVLECDNSNHPSYLASLTNRKITAAPESFAFRKNGNTNIAADRMVSSYSVSRHTSVCACLSTYR